MYKVALIGNPNSGKSSLFNALTGSRQRTGNWPGVTVERKEGILNCGQASFLLIDLPGTYSLDPSETSADERIAREFILSRQADLIVNIVDATHLERSLYLSLQLIETEIPVCLALNMMDLAQRQGLAVDPQALSQVLGVAVIPTVARTGQGVEALKAVLVEQTHCPRQAVKLAYPIPVEHAIAALEAEMAAFSSSPRLDALMALAGQPTRQEQPATLEPQIARLRAQTEQELGEEFDLIVAHTRYQKAREIAQRVSKQSKANRISLSDRIDAIVLHRWLGIPLFLLMMYLMFTFTINLGGAFVDCFDLAAQAILVDGFRQLLTSLGAPGWLSVFLADGIGGGLQVVATFIPIIGFLYLFLSLLEDSGYMARAALIMDRLMYKLGLPGKAFVPLIVGFGCNVPAIMATRTLERERERLLTVMMAPFMSCSARLAVYALFAAAFFPHGGQNVVFALYLVGIAAALFSAIVLKTTLLPGQPQPLLIELPSYQWPSWRNLILHTWLRLKGFVTGAGKYIVGMVMVINVLNAWSTDGRIDPKVPPESSTLSAMAKAITPVFAPLGIREDNWPAVVGILSGVLAKEVVVGTLDALYSRLDQAETTSEDKESFHLPTALREAAATLPENLSKAWSKLADPLGLRVLESARDPNQAAQELETRTTTFGAMVRRFDGPVGAFAYLLFILLYSPCVAATATIRREIGWGWMAFAILWTTGLAFAVATLYYQAATFPSHPLQATIYIASIGAAGGLAYALLRLVGSKHRQAHTSRLGQGLGLFHRSCCK